MAENFVIGPGSALLAVDLQYDFMPGGGLAVALRHETVPAVNRLARLFANVVLTQDWHPPGHASFASSHPGKKPFETTRLAYGEQVLWPDHCVQGTPGADLHKDLDVKQAQLIIRKGYHAGIDSYSALFEADRKNTHRSCRLSAPARPEAPVSSRTRHRFLRCLVGGRRGARRLRRRGGGRRLPRHRRERIARQGLRRHARRGREAHDDAGPGRLGRRYFFPRCCLYHSTNRGRPTEMGVVGLKPRSRSLAAMSA